MAVVEMLVSYTWVVTFVPLVSRAPQRHSPAPLSCTEGGHSRCSRLQSDARLPLLMSLLRISKLLSKKTQHSLMTAPPPPPLMFCGMLADASVQNWVVCADCVRESTSLLQYQLFGFDELYKISPAYSSCSAEIMQVWGSSNCLRPCQVPF